MKNDMALLRAQINEALDIHESAGLNSAAAIAEMIKLTVALSLKVNGPTSTVVGLHAMLGQLDGIFPAAAARAAFDGDPPVKGTA